MKIALLLFMTAILLVSCGKPPSSLIQEIDIDRSNIRPKLGILFKPNQVKMFDYFNFQRLFDVPKPEKYYVELLKMNFERMLPSISSFSEVIQLEDSIEYFSKTYKYRGSYIDISTPKKDFIENIYKERRIDYLLVIDGYSVYLNEKVSFDSYKPPIDYYPGSFTPHKDSPTPTSSSREINNSANIVIINCKTNKEVEFGKVRIGKSITVLNRSTYLECISDFINYIIKDSQFNL
jgi:hypothetical protein